MKPSLLVLAAGMGSRYGGLKQMDTVGAHGETIIDYSLYDALASGFGKIVFLIRKDIEADFREAVGKKYETRCEVKYAFQELDKIPEGFSVPPSRKKPWGTGHAVLCAQEAIEEPFAVINCDDFYGRSSFRIIQSFLSQRADDSTEFCMVGYTLANTLSENGSVSRGICALDVNDYLQEVVEHTKIEKAGDAAVSLADEDKPIALTGQEIVSLNMFGFSPRIFHFLSEGLSVFLKENINSEKGEFYIPSLVDSLIKSREASVKVLKTDASWFGITYKEDEDLVVNNIRALTERGDYPAPLMG